MSKFNASVKELTPSTISMFAAVTSFKQANEQSSPVQQP